MANRAMPNWPRRMQADMAAMYLGISRSKFLEGVGGKYPKPVKDGGNSLWHIEDLDAAADSLKGLPVLKGSRFTERLKNAAAN